MVMWFVFGGLDLGLGRGSDFYHQRTSRFRSFLELELAVVRRLVEEPVVWYKLSLVVDPIQRDRDAVVQKRTQSLPRVQKVRGTRIVTWHF